ncbi:g7496 [Coccomyxa elongata]
MSPAARPASLRKISNAFLHVSKPTWWLESRFHFSFADYYNPKNTNFGVLRVLNDDLVKGHAGFGTHSHRDAEIFSYILDGNLMHADSMGNKESLPRGAVQYLSAGSGIRHSEMNDWDETTRFLQIWITPDQRGHKPQYGSRVHAHEDRHNRLLHLLGGTGIPLAWNNVHSVGQPISLHQDVNVYVSENDPNVAQEIALGEGRQAYLVAIEGSLDVNGTSLEQRDAVELVAGSQQMPVTLTSGNIGSHFMLIEMVAA